MAPKKTQGQPKAVFDSKGIDASTRLRAIKNPQNHQKAGELNRSNIVTSKDPDRPVNQHFPIR